MFKLTCDKCSTKKKYCSEYDTYLCEACDEWTEADCSCPPEENCDFKGRPEKPSMREKA